MLDIDSLWLTDVEIGDIEWNRKVPETLELLIADAQLAKAFWGVQVWMEVLHEEMPSLVWIDGAPVALDAHLRDLLLAVAIAKPNG